MLIEFCRVCNNVKIYQSYLNYKHLNLFLIKLKQDEILNNNVTNTNSNISYDDI